MRLYHFCVNIKVILLPILAATACIMLPACSGAYGAGNGMENGTGSSGAEIKGMSEQESTGIVQVSANAMEYTISPMLDSVVIEYSKEPQLPDELPSKLYSFNDGTETREIRAVYTNNSANVREDEKSVPGKYVIIQLKKVENLHLDRETAWLPESEAGRTIRLTGSHSAFRTDYSELSIYQNFDAKTVSGQMIQKSGEIPKLRYEDVQWPEVESFTIDEVLNGPDGEIHYSYYLPREYDPSAKYPMMVVMPGYDGLLLSLEMDSRGINVFSNRAVVAWAQAPEDMIVVAPQLTDWGEKSARQTIELTEHFLKNYAVDPGRVYASGYSAGGETMSRVMGTRADLFAAYLHCSSQWDGGYAQAAKSRTAVYIFMAESDEYYGSEKAREAYQALCDSYRAEGIPEDELKQLLVLNLPEDDYFNRRGIYQYHSGGQSIVNEDEVVRWVLSQHKEETR